MKFGQLIEYNMRNISVEKSNKMWWRNYFKTYFWKIKIEYVCESML